MDDYARFVLERARITARNPVSASAASEPEPAPRDAGPSASTLRRRLEETEAALAKATEVVAGLDVELADPDVYVSSPARAAALGARRIKAQAALDAAEAKWLEAAEKLEAAMVEA
jgi:ATP-binding cassette subfamily F protein 3